MVFEYVEDVVVSTVEFGGSGIEIILGGDRLFVGKKVDFPAGG